MKGRCVVTGGAGFLGSHLCDRLLKEGYEVICIDNLITGSMRNLEQLKGNRNFHFIRQDVTTYLSIEGALAFVFHFASPASPIDYIRFPIQTLKVGALGVHKTLGLAKSKNAVHVLASTSEIYGDPLVHPQKEDYWGNVNPVGPRGVYDEAKRFAEAMAMAYHRYHSVRSRIVRIFNTYGPRMRAYDGRVVPSFICQALRDEPLTVYGDGSQTRSFCYVSDMIEGIYRQAKSDISTPVNIGSSHEMTVRELADLVLSLTGSKSRVVYEPLPRDDPKVRRPDITKARGELGWEPEVPLEEGLQKTISYFKEVVDL